MKEVKWVVTCYQDNDDRSANAYHLVAYHEKPEDSDIISLINELKTDKNLNMSDMNYGSDYKISVAKRDNDELKELFDQWGVPDKF